MNAFNTLVAAFENELGKKESLSLTAALQSWLSEFEPAEHDDAFKVFWHNVPGFTAFKTEFIWHLRNEAQSYADAARRLSAMNLDENGATQAQRATEATTLADALDKE